MYETRFAKVKLLLPIDKVVGYITDKNAIVALNDNDTLQNFYLAQYAIIPTKLTNSTKPEVVLGNFSSRVIDMQYLSEKQLVVEKNFGNGVVLLRHKTP